MCSGPWGRAVLTRCDPGCPVSLAGPALLSLGASKTLLAQQLLTSVATGREWLGLPACKRRAFGLLCEDHEHDLHINQKKINRAYWTDYEDLGDLRLWRESSLLSP